MLCFRYICFDFYSVDDFIGGKYNSEGINGYFIIFVFFGGFINYKVFYSSVRVCRTIDIFFVGCFDIFVDV